MTTAPKDDLEKRIRKWSDSEPPYNTSLQPVYVDMMRDLIADREKMKADFSYACRSIKTFKDCLDQAVELLRQSQPYITKTSDVSLPSRIKKFLEYPNQPQTEEVKHDKS